jgi:hypothetical protein
MRPECDGCPFEKAKQSTAISDFCLISKSANLEHSDPNSAQSGSDHAEEPGLGGGCVNDVRPKTANQLNRLPQSSQVSKRRRLTYEVDVMSLDPGIEGRIITFDHARSNGYFDTGIDEVCQLPANQD